MGYVFDVRDYLSELPSQCCRIRCLVDASHLDGTLRVANAATWRIPELDVEQESFAHRGFQGSIRGFLTHMHREVLEARGRAPSAAQAQFDTFLARVGEFLAGDAAACTLEVEDTSGLSTVGDELSPTVELYDRSVRDERLLGVQYPEPSPQKQSAADVAALVRRAQRVVAFTGAGISVESGITPFRSTTDKNVLWAEFDAERLTQDGFNRDPEVTAEWWVMKRKLLKDMEAAKPNAAHVFFDVLDKQGKLLRVVTQNIDSLHQRAGVPQEKVIELHGHMRRVICADHRTPLNPVPHGNGACDYACDPSELDLGPGSPTVPLCPRCGLPLRHETVMFKQGLPEGCMDSARQAVANCDLLIVVGSSLVVQPANELPAEAFRRGIPVVMINMEETACDANALCVVRSPAGQFLGEVAELLAQPPGEEEQHSAAQ